MEIPEELPLVAFSPREDPRDVLVLPKGQDRPDLTKPIGTSSLRRIIQLKRLFPDAEFQSVRGNLQTRIRKLDEGQYGAIVLAAAGMKRMGLAGRISCYFDTADVIPSAGQAVLAVQGRRDGDASMFLDFTDQDAADEVAAERSFVTYLNGGCSSPIAAHAQVSGGEIYLDGLYFDENTREAFRGSLSGGREEAEQMGVKLAQMLQRHEGEYLGTEDKE